jgi:Fur family iron response transcriptional regulator
MRANRTRLNFMSAKRPYTDALQRLRAAGLRPTRQRLALAKLLFDASNRHVTAEQLHAEAQAARARISLATVYNTLHQFTSAGLLREVVVEPGRFYFDTNTMDHHHILDEATGELTDISGESLKVTGLPAAPDGATVKRVDVIVRLN